MTYALRDYQTAGNEAIRDLYRQGKRRALLVMPTGAGKTLTGADMLAGTNRKGKRVLWVTDRQELAEQAGDAFDAAGVPFSWITADQEPDKLGSAWVGTIQSFLARQGKGRWVPPYVDLIVLDEAHRSESASMRALYETYPSAYSVGLTATPMRGDGRGLGNTYDGMVNPITTAELIARGFLVPPRYYIPSQIDTSSVNKPNGDYSRDDLEQIAADNPQLIGDVVENFARICPQRRAVAFPMTIRHSLALRDAFNAAGIPACHIDGQTHKPTRRELMRAFREGEYQVLTSVNIAIEGLDVPDVSAVILARPTKSERIWVQAVGRGLRAFPDKTDCIAEDSLVLTDYGLVKIQDVTRKMKLWDGINWVNHSGIICHGTREVITYAGLTATADHRVWTQEGWKPFGLCAAKQIPIAQTGLGGQAIREGRNYVTGSRVAWKKTEYENVCVHHLSDLWQNCLDFVQQSFSGADRWLSQLWTATSSPQMALHASPRYAAALSESQLLTVPRLRGPWNRVSIHFTSRGGALGARAPWLGSQQATRQDRQRWALRTGKYSLVNSAAEYGPYEKDAGVTNGSSLQDGSPRSEICRRDIERDVQPGNDCGGNLHPLADAVSQTERRVWDILDAGPLHRFTVSGLLVHNCIVLDHAGCLAIHGPAEDFTPPPLHARKGKTGAGSVSKKRPPRDQTEMTCEECSAVFYASRVCPMCGHLHETERAPKDVTYAEAELVELTQQGRVDAAADLERRKQWWRELQGYSLNKGYAPGWAFHKFKEKFGSPPPWELPPVAPGPEVLRWVKARNIAYWKAQEQHVTHAAD